MCLKYGHFKLHCVSVLFQREHFPLVFPWGSLTNLPPATGSRGPNHIMHVPQHFQLAFTVVVIVAIFYPFDFPVSKYDFILEK
jgi:hypothetical protein